MRLSAEVKEAEIELIMIFFVVTKQMEKEVILICTNIAVFRLTHVTSKMLDSMKPFAELLYNQQ